MLGLDHQEAVGLGDPARDLGEELGPGHADRDRRARPAPAPGPQANGDLGRRARDPAKPAHLEEGLVDRHALDERGRVVEHLEDRLAGLAVGLHVRRDDDRLGAEAPGLPTAHGAADTVGPGLVARCEHHTTPDDDRLAAEPRIVTLVDRREEGIEVGVQDRGLVAHEHMFDPTADGIKPGSGMGPAGLQRET